MDLKISVRIRDLIPSIVETSKFANESLNKQVVFEDKCVYNKITSLVTYYSVKNSDKNCSKKYKEFTDLLPELNNLLGKYRLAVMQTSFGNSNPFMQSPLLLDKK